MKGKDFETRFRAVRTKRHPKQEEPCAFVRRTVAYENFRFLVELHASSFLGFCTVHYRFTST